MPQFFSDVFYDIVGPYTLNKGYLTKYDDVNITRDFLVALLNESCRCFEQMWIGDIANLSSLIVQREEYIHSILSLLHIKCFCEKYTRTMKVDDILAAIPSVVPTIIYRYEPDRDRNAAAIRADMYDMTW